MDETKTILLCPGCDNSSEVLMLIKYCKIRFICPYCGNKISPRKESFCVFSKHDDKCCHLKMNVEKSVNNY
jgi:hypothetical protein